MTADFYDQIVLENEDDVTPDDLPFTSPSQSRQLEKASSSFLAAHNVKLRELRGRSDVGALSLDDDRPGHQVDETQIIAGHGGWSWRDPRYAEMQAKYAALVVADDPLTGKPSKQHVTAYPARGDDMGSDEREDLYSRLDQMLDDERIPKTLRNLFQRIVDGDAIDHHDVRRWLPKIEQMREEGVLS